MSLYRVFKLILALTGEGTTIIYMSLYRVFKLILALTGAGKYSSHKFSVWHQLYYLYSYLESMII